MACGFLRVDKSGGSYSLLCFLGHQQAGREAPVMQLSMMLIRLILLLFTVFGVSIALPNSNQSESNVPRHNKPRSAGSRTPHGRPDQRQSIGGVGVGQAHLCKTHLIAAGDTCDSIARQNKITVRDLERWNKKTWAWTNCGTLMASYSMCISDGDPPLPPPQKAAECGPMKPGTQQPPPRCCFERPQSMSSQCMLQQLGILRRVAPALRICEVHAPKGGGPGSIAKGFSSTCVSNCGIRIKTNSAAAPLFQRIGYFESFGVDRKCLRMSAKDANTDGSYTHMHRAFGLIDPNTWAPMINESHREQWNEFKALPNMKRIISFGGWADSTEAATYGILRDAII